MNNRKFQNEMEKGQMIPLVVILMFVILGMVALVIDGGSIMSNRRTAQAAADAGALAGAQRICEGHGDAVAVAEYYATVNNEATVASATYNGGAVTVQTVVQNPSFFARIFGEETLTASAEAVAGCYHPSKAKRLLPIAFYYQTPPIKANAADCSDFTQPCSIVNWDFMTLMNTLQSTNAAHLPLDNIYIVAETTKVCEKPVSGAIVCTEVLASASGGNRTWLDFSKLGGANNLKKVIRDGFDETLTLPAWVNGQPGVNNSIYAGEIFSGLEKIPGYEGLDARLVVVPVFDKFCVRDPESNCGVFGDHYFIDNANKQSYRLVGLAPFVVTCVTKNSKCEFGDCIPARTGLNTTNKPICPGFLLSGEDKSAIEGYFVDEVPSDNFVWGVGGVDVGINIISLSK